MRNAVIGLILAACLPITLSATPNVVFILTDDQSDAFWKDYDSEHQPKLRKYLSEQGATVQVRVKHSVNQT